MEKAELLVVEQAVKQLNKEYTTLLNSREYCLGKKMLRFIQDIRTLNIVKIIKMIKTRKKNQVVTKKYIDKAKNIMIERSIENVINNMSAIYSVTVYTCIVGKYDAPNSPLLRFKNYRYILFTDQLDLQCNGWEIHKIPRDIMSNYSPTEVNRYIKFHPQEFFNTDYSCYVDGNVRILTSLDSFIESINTAVGISMFDHPYRECLYREAQTCIYLGKGNSTKIAKQIDSYKKEGMPYNFGLKEATIIMVDLNNENGVYLLNEWWKEFYKWKSGRDQLALPYVVWKEDLTMDAIGSLGENIREDHHFQVAYHGSRESACEEEDNE